MLRAMGVEPSQQFCLDALKNIVNQKPVNVITRLNAPNNFGIPSLNQNMAG
ncbi:35782_t:CDS:1, partial [Racocetra persica]